MARPASVTSEPHGSCTPANAQRRGPSNAGHAMPVAVTWVGILIPLRHCRVPKRWMGDCAPRAFLATNGNPTHRDELRWPACFFGGKVVMVKGSCALSCLPCREWGWVLFFLHTGLLGIFCGNGFWYSGGLVPSLALSCEYMQPGGTHPRAQLQDVLLSYFYFA